jgi:hypothetical protein
VNGILETKATSIDRDGQERPVTLDDIVIMTASDLNYPRSTLAVMPWTAVRIVARSSSDGQGR